MRNPFRNDSSSGEPAHPAGVMAPERPGYDDEGRDYEGDGGPGAREPAPAAAHEPTEVHEQAGAPARRPRRGIGWHSRNASAAAAGAVGGGVLMLSRLVIVVAGLIALLIALAILLFDLGANPSNAIVEGIHEGANFFAGAFTGVFTFGGKPKLELSVDWAIAAVVFVIVGAVIAAAIRSVGAVGVRFEQRHRPAL